MINKDQKSEEIIQHKLDEVKNSLSHQDYFNSYILETLNSFSYRYFDEPKMAEMDSLNVFKVYSIEKGIKEAIKNKNPELRAGISELVKRVSKAEGPTILREIRIILNRAQGTSGTCKVLGRISFGHPEHDFKKGTYIESVKSFNFEDDIHLRNELSKDLEAVCEIFLN